jgi:hypothetical protein
MLIVADARATVGGTESKKRSSGGRTERDRLPRKAPLRREHPLRTPPAAIRTPSRRRPPSRRLLVACKDRVVLKLRHVANSIVSSTPSGRGKRQSSWQRVTPAESTGCRVRGHRLLTVRAPTLSKHHAPRCDRGTARGAYFRAMESAPGRRELEAHAETQFRKRDRASAALLPEAQRSSSCRWAPSWVQLSISESPSSAMLAIELPLPGGAVSSTRVPWSSRA